ncbi:MAG: acetyltransferase [Syntrophobacteraceae bacterium]|nr:acetyltransferase [Syntrophobacteraceae bacterium]
MNYIIVGAGGMGREVYSWLLQTIANNVTHRIIGFIDDNPNALDTYSYPIDVIQNISSYEPSPNHELILAILDPQKKQEIAMFLLNKGARFYTLIHPSAIIGANVTIGEGSIICPNCILTSDLKIGRFVFLNTSSTIGHDSIIGDYCSINGKVEITGNVQIGSACLFGVGAKVIPGRKIGEGATIGAGSIVIRHVPAHTTVFGNPAKKI